MRGRAVVLLVAVALLAASPSRTARAEDTTTTESAAADLFRAGSAAYASGDYRAAALAFEQAHRISPRAPTLVNAGLAWQGAGVFPRAADDFDRALASHELDPATERDVGARLAVVAARCGRLAIDGPPGAHVTVAHVRDASMPIVVHVLPGPYDVKITARDGTVLPARSVTVKEQETQTVHVALPAPAPAPALKVVSPSPEHAPSRTRRTIGWIGVASGAALGATACVLGLMTLSARDGFVASGNHDADARDRAILFRTLTNVAVAVAIPIAAAGVTLVVTAPSSASFQLRRMF